MPYKKRNDVIKYYSVEYTDSYTEELDKEGLKVLKWSMFDSPEKLGSGKMFMESAPVHILDEVFYKQRINAFIMLGYTSKPYADRLRLSSDNPHRLGKAIKFRCISKIKRLKIVRGLIQYGIERIHLHNEWIYFDTDNYIKKPEIVLF
jgi:hypothetical protein